MGLFSDIGHDPNGTILAQNKFLTLDTWESHLNNNIMLVGSSGRGKTRHFIKPNIMQMNCNYVISDPKGTVVVELGSMLEREGYKIKVLNLVDLEHSDTYNPFRYVKCQADVYKLIDYLLINLNPKFGQGKDPFWDNSSKALLSAICFLLCEEYTLDCQTFHNVMMLLRCHDIKAIDADFESTLDILFKELEAKNPNHIAVKQYKVFKAAAAPETASSILVTTEVYLQNFNLKEFDNITATDTIHLEELSEEKTALFVIISDTDPSKNWLAGIFYSQLFDILCNQENKHHIRFILDDFVCTGRIPDFDYKMAMVRSRNISCMIALQDEAQLEKEYDKAAQGIITNCDSYVFLGSPNVDICDKVAHRLGDKRITGAELRKMDNDSCVVIYGNQGGIFKKYDLTKHPRYKEIADTKKSPMRYDLAGKHRVPMYYSDNPEDGEHKSENVTVKSGYFDSLEEKYLCCLLAMIENFDFFPHVQLRDIFCAGKTAYSMKISYMHCDFVAMDDNWKPLFGIEIDGSHHNEDPEQFANDRIKDYFFESNSLPLLRFSASDVRNHTQRVLDKIIATANKIIYPRSCYLTCRIPTYCESELKEKTFAKYLADLEKTRCVRISREAK